MPKSAKISGMRVKLGVAVGLFAAVSACDVADTVGPLNELVPPFTTIAAGSRHTCALDREGVAYCWGSGFDGQTGLARTELPFRPRPLTTSLRFSALSAGARSTCAIEADGAGAYCWGTLGGGSIPSLIDGSEGAQAIALTVDHACLRFGDGSVGCFGANDYGQLGPGAPPTPDPVTSVVLVPGVTAIGAPAVGERHSCALDPFGTVSCWGMHEGGQLGIGATTEECAIGPAGEPRPCSAAPSAVASGPFEKVVAGVYHTCALRTDGRTECWGDDDTGQLGLMAGGPDLCEWLVAGSVVPRGCARSPELLDTEFVASDLGAGYFLTCGLEPDGNAQCWGTDDFSQTGGLGSPGQPGLVAGGMSWATIGGGQLHTCGVTASGAAYCWGDGQYGQLGSTSEFAGEPLRVTGF